MNVGLDPVQVANPAGLARAFRLFGAKGALGKRWRAALAIALVSDLISFWVHFVPPVQVAVDLGTVILMLLCLRWRWVWLLALIPEAFPGWAMFPFWSLVLIALAAIGSDDTEKNKKSSETVIDAEAIK